MRTLLLGLDAFDPRVFERLYEQGRMPNLARFVTPGHYAHLAVPNPPQSEVSWTSLATGLNSGGHGIFDFVHRNPRTYAPFLSLLPTERRFGAMTFVPPSPAPTLFDQAARLGYPATNLWWPATFPSRQASPVRTLPGLGTPDIHGRLGVGTIFSRDPESSAQGSKTTTGLLRPLGRNRWIGDLEGPGRKGHGGVQHTHLRFELEWNEAGRALLRINRQQLELDPGTWSPIFEVKFPMGPLLSLRGLTRAILVEEPPDVRLYFLPLHQRPLRSPWPCGSPGSFVGDLWKHCGPFLTLGWPQDTTALEEGHISDQQFLDLCDQITTQRERILLRELDRFDEGIVGCVFDSLDRIQHMFRRDRPDIVERAYERFDEMAGRIHQKLASPRAEPARLLILSDHGFTEFNYKVHLNHWLWEQGYLHTVSGEPNGKLEDVDWKRSRAYALGLNSLYLNRLEREAKGQVSEEQVEPLVGELRAALTSWRGPDGRPVVRSALPNSDAFEGELSGHGPDLVVAYASGYRASAETGMGQWKAVSIEPNLDHWGADHCVDAARVPGVLFLNSGTWLPSTVSYEYVPELSLGAPIEGGQSPPPPLPQDEDMHIVEERLRSLGYF